MKTMKPRHLILLTALLLPACAPCKVGSIRIGNTPARAIAKDTSIPGKGVDGQCLPYARALHRKFQAAGIPSRILVFNYDSLGGAGSPFSTSGAFGIRRGQSGAHAVVAYNDAGRTYLMDNQSWMPTWVHDDGIAGMAQQFAGMDMKVSDARGYSTPSGARSRGARPASPSRTTPGDLPNPTAPDAPAMPAYLTSLD